MPKHKKQTELYSMTIIRMESHRIRVLFAAQQSLFAGILWIRLAGYGYDEFVPNYERSLRWIIKNRYAANHPDPNLRGGVINTRMRMKKGQIWLTQRDVGTSFGLRFLAAYYNLKFNK